jgi:hypothetical protein
MAGPAGKAPSIDEPYSGLRRKDRVTYTHNLFQIDLTQVKTFEVSLSHLLLARQHSRTVHAEPVSHHALSLAFAQDNGSSAKTTHELELEILDAKKFLGYGYLARTGQDIQNRWEEAMDCVLNTVRLLNKNATPPLALLPPAGAGAGNANANANGNAPGGMTMGPRPANQG